MFPDMATSPLLTAEDVERLSLPGKQVELVRGQLVVREPPSTLHGEIAGNLAFHLGAFVRRHDLGRVFPQDTGFKIASDPDTVRGPDAAFVGRGRLDQIPRRGYAAFAPDLVAEVLSPGDTAGEALAKVAEWLAAGTKVVWLIDPERREARVYRSDGSLTVIDEHGSLEGEDVLPGFSLPLRDVVV